MYTTSRAEKYRKPHPLKFKQSPGDPFGFFVVPTKMNGTVMAVIASAPGDVPDSSDTEFEHVSVSMAHRCPTWDEMCKIKNLFWDDTDVVVQYHPAKKQYINLAKNCLHLWRWTKGEIPTPKSIEVGF